VSSNPYGQGPEQSPTYEDYSQGYTGAPQPPTYGQTNYQQPTYAPQDPYGQPTYGQPYTQRYVQTPGYEQAPGYGQAPGYAQQYGQELAPYTAMYDSNPRPSVSMGQAIQLWFKNWKNFSGRASRSEYWWVALAMGILSMIFMAVFVAVILVAAAATNGSDSAMTATMLLTWAVMAVVGLVTFVPSLSLGVRRLHDTNQSGWLYLVNFIPYAGPIILIVLMAQRSNLAGARFDDAAQPLYGPENL